MKQPRFSKRQRLAIVFAVILLVVVLVIAIRPKQKTASKPSVAAVPLPAEAVQTVTAYLQARENNIGADQSGPAAWLSAVQPLSTAGWFTKLQPPPTSLTSSTSYNYRLAHTNGYTVKASVTNCIWDRDVMAPSTTQGAVICSVYDNTYGSDGRVVAAADLPFGWTATGQQPAAVLKIILQNDRWLVADDLTGQGA